MSGWTLKLKAEPDERLDLSPLMPSKLASASDAAIAAIKIGTSKRGLTVGDVFTISGSAGDTLTIQGGSEKFDFAGAGLDGGTIIIDGPVGAMAGAKMSGGKLEVRGPAGVYLATGLSGGLIHVKGSAGECLGGVRTGERFGMTGGTVVVEGDIGPRAGDKMRRGTVIVRGKAGAGAGTRMVGGTIWAEQGFAAVPAPMMRRGTLIGPSVERLLPTFADCGRHDLVVVRVLGRYLTQTLGVLAPKPIAGPVHKFAGDMATIGKGEILLTG